MTAILEQILVIAAVGASAGFLAMRFFRSRKPSCKCDACPSRPAVDGDQPPPATPHSEPSRD